MQIKAGQILKLSEEIQRNVSQSALEINDIYKCFQDKQTRANATKLRALAAQSSIGNVADVSFIIQHEPQSISGIKPSFIYS